MEKSDKKISQINTSMQARKKDEHDVQYVAINNEIQYFTLEHEKLSYHPVHARNRFGPKSALSLAKLNMKVYMITVGSATPRINSG